MNYSLRQLRIFITVAQAKSFSRAGDRIGLSQSAVSHSVKELERQTGVRLLDRTTREVVLTEAGQQLATRLERVLDELNSIRRQSRDTINRHRARCREPNHFCASYSAMHCPK